MLPCESSWKLNNLYLKFAYHLFQVIHNQDNSQSGESKTSDPSATSKLELLGFNTGYRFIERLSKDYPKFKDELDLLKFICKDFWVAVFRWVLKN